MKQGSNAGQCERESGIEARLNAATPGPWVSHDLSDAVYSPDDNTGWWWVWQESRLPNYGGVFEPTDRSPNDGSIGCAAIDDNRTGLQEKADAEFIAHSPEDVRYLLAELRKRDAVIANVSALVDSPDQTLIKPKGDKVFYVEAHRIRSAVAAKP